MTEAMPFLQKYDITFLRPPTIDAGRFIHLDVIWLMTDYSATACRAARAPS